ncbi:ABC-2 type transporter [Methanobacterium lacus]|uniref:ABC-2 type transporter n=1 Tax=Methanobacterium lacus (strain AL-21) TaxID=877455 RepID=F0T7I7_METLA|nr:ABC transporter permease [Methanobacterium lacus]ADZ09555.1 ABC-2 type transporter [Methanobacterium lacus]
MKFMSIASKDLKELLRDRRGLFFILLLPIFFMLIFSFAFGTMGQDNQPNSIAVVNLDTGVTLPNGTTVNYGNNFTDTMKGLKYQDTDVNLFNITQTSEANATNLVKQRNVDLELIIPAGFSQSMVDMAQTAQGTDSAGSMTLNSSTGNVTSKLVIRGDKGYSGFGTSLSILTGAVGSYQDGIIGAMGGVEPQEFIQTSVEGIPGTQSFTAFDYIAPGMMVFAILLLSTSVAAMLTKEVESGTLRRLKLSEMTSFDYLFGGLLPWSLVAGAQIIILLAVAIMFGFHWQGGLNSIILAAIIGVVGGVASISLGMIIASFAKNPPQASQLGTLIAVPVSFLVGAFFQLPQVVIGTFMGQEVQIYSILPWYQIATALRTVLTNGGGWDSIVYNMAAAVVLTAILFVLGVYLFSKSRLKSEKT